MSATQLYSPISAATVSPRRPSALAWIAFGVSVLAALGLWAELLSLTSTWLSVVFVNGSRQSQEILSADAALTYLLVPAIVLDIIAGVRGGSSRLVAAIGGLILLSPAIAALITFFS